MLASPVQSPLKISIMLLRRDSKSSGSYYSIFIHIYYHTRSLYSNLVNLYKYSEDCPYCCVYFFVYSINQACHMKGLCTTLKLHVPVHFFFLGRKKKANIERPLFCYMVCIGHNLRIVIHQLHLFYWHT